MPEHAKPPICAECVDIHGRDTRMPVQCPRCHQLVGCFWHDAGVKHLRKCPQEPV